MKKKIEKLTNSPTHPFRVKFHIYILYEYKLFQNWPFPLIFTAKPHTLEQKNNIRGNLSLDQLFVSLAI